MKAKAKLTRLWSVLLVLVMVVGLLPTTALAAEPATTTADFAADPGAALALLNAAKTGAADSTWDAETNTLTLNGVNFTTTNRIAVKLPDGAIIELNGENTITSTFSGSGKSYGIYVPNGDLTIQGTGKLTVTGGAAGYSYGIYAEQGSVTISAATVIANGGAAGYSYGIDARNNVTINSGTVKANGGAAIFSYGIDAYGSSGCVNISDGTVIANGGTVATGEADYSISCGINSENSVIISGGVVTATGGTCSDAEGGSYGINSANGQTHISGGAVIAKGTTTTGISWGTYFAPVLDSNYTAYWWRNAADGVDGVK